jgi:hypothetical protein
VRDPENFDVIQTDFAAGSHFFLTCSLLGINTPALSGTVVSSLHRLKDLDNKEGAFFVFGDVSIKVEGTYQLQFDLYEMQETEQCVHICTTISQPFPVVSSKNFNGMPESTGLTRTFSEQGVRLRLRKEPRSLLKPKGPATEEYKPRQYRTNPRAQSSHSESLPSPVSSNSSHFTPGLPLDHQDSQIQSTYMQQMKHPTRSYASLNDQSPIVSPNYEDRRTKRPRTGSEQGQMQSYALQTQAFDSTYQNLANFPANTVTGFTPLQHYGGMNYASSSFRDTYNSPRGDAQRSFSYGDPNSNYSTGNTRYLAQSQIIPSQTHYLDTAGNDRQHSDADYSSVEFAASRPYAPHSMNVVPIIPSDWRATSETAYQTLSETAEIDERHIYGVYQNQSINTSTG